METTAYVVFTRVLMKYKVSLLLEIPINKRKEY
jgi:hypothetical protein